MLTSPPSIIFEPLALLALDQMLTYYAHLLILFSPQCLVVYFNYKVLSEKKLQAVGLKAAKKIGRLWEILHHSADNEMILVTPTDRSAVF